MDPNVIEKGNNGFNKDKMILLSGSCASSPWWWTCERIRTVCSTAWEAWARKATHAVLEICSGPPGRFWWNAAAKQFFFFGPRSQQLEKSCGRLLRSRMMMMILLLRFSSQIHLWCISNGVVLGACESPTSLTTGACSLARHLFTLTSGPFFYHISIYLVEFWSILTYFMVSFL